MLGVGSDTQSVPGSTFVPPPAEVPAAVPVAGDAITPSSGASGSSGVSEAEAWAVLTAVDRLGPVAFAALLACYRNARSVLRVAAEHGAIQRLVATPPLDLGRDHDGRAPIGATLATAIVEAAAGCDAILDRLRSMDLRVVTLDDAVYPRKLRAIELPPHVLFVRGSVEAPDSQHAIAVVGTRRPTAYGRATTVRITDALVDAGATVISGLAYGIDGAAHEATLRRGGSTVAVIGGGHATGIPRAHRRLADAIVNGGGAVISEYAPDTEPTRGTFPRRNRIISGLARATVVVEAPARSGALITASWALEQGRDCFVVPGPIDGPASAGCLAFLREFHDEARIVSGIPQLIADLDLMTMRRGTADAVAAAAVTPLGPTVGRVAEAVVAGAATIDELVAVTDLPVATVLAAIGLLEGRGLVVGMHGRYRAVGALLGERVWERPR